MFDFWNWVWVFEIEFEFFKLSVSAEFGVQIYNVSFLKIEFEFKFTKRPLIFVEHSTSLFLQLYRYDPVQKSISKILKLN